MTNILNYLFSILIAAQKKKKLTVQIIRKSKFILIILDLLIKEGYINSYVRHNYGNKITIYLKYYNKQPLLNNFIFVSKSGKKQYFTYKQLIEFFIKNGLNLFLIISTSKGLMSAKCALVNKIGGEPLIYLL